MRENQPGHRSKPKPTTLLTIRVTDEERKAIKEAAKKYGDDNVSYWVRLAAMAYKPSVSGKS